MSGKVWAALILAATVPQLALGAFDSSLPQFEGKAFGVRLFAYPIMMLVAPAAWFLVRRRRRSTAQLPWPAFALNHGAVSHRRDRQHVEPLRHRPPLGRSQPLC
jgi:hypothetical protein